MEVKFRETFTVYSQRDWICTPERAKVRNDHCPKVRLYETQCDYGNQKVICDEDRIQDYTE
jgi:hypothetical protein